MPTLDRVLRLTSRTQRYAWGKRGVDSLVARLAGEVAEEPFAELWVGAHPSSPSLVVLDEEEIPLNRLVSFYPEQILGKRVVESFGKSLPFLFKILSVGSPLSIQVHPDRVSAERLFREQPKLYPDANHKPEVGIALSDVLLLYGFRQWSEIAQWFAAVPEFRFVVDEEAVEEFISSPSEELLQLIVRQLVTASAEALQESCEALYQRLASKSSPVPEEEWVLRVQSEYPAGDAGVFFFFLLNLIPLRPGEAIFTEPGVPHAYLSGDLVECMANSDNVVRAGLTPKPRDMETALHLMNLSPPEGGVFVGEPTSHTHLYRTSAAEFVVESFRADFTRAYTLGAVQLFFSVDGEGRLQDHTEEVSPFAPGDAFLVPATVPYVDISIESGLLFRATVP